MRIDDGTKVVATVSTDAKISVMLSAPASVDVGVGTQTYIDHESYSGPYEVTPASNEQSLRTADKQMRRDVTIHKVPYYETSNEGGGVTVSILS
jgi:hypothetical protein